MQNRFSNLPAVKKSEKNFSNLSNLFPQFAAFKFDKKAYQDGEGLKIIVLMQAGGDRFEILEHVKVNLNQMIGSSKLNFSSSDINFKEVKYNFRQLQAYRDVIYMPIMTSESVTLINLDDAKNRIVVGVKNENYKSHVEALLSKLPVPREAIKIDVFNLNLQQSDDNTEFFVKNTTGQVNYEWRIKWENSSSWSYLGNSSSQGITIINDNNFTIKLAVTDDVSANEYELPVTVVTQDCSDPTLPCQN